MGIEYYGICHDCEKYIELDKFGDWAAMQNADHASVELTELDLYLDKSWIYKTLRLHIFIASHNGHRIGVYSEYDFDNNYSKFDEQYKWPHKLSALAQQIDLGRTIDRLVINTPLGQIIIDHRGKDINCFRFIDGKRVDTQLLEVRGIK